MATVRLFIAVVGITISNITSETMVVCALNNKWSQHTMSQKPNKNPVKATVQVVGGGIVTRILGKNLGFLALVLSWGMLRLAIHLLCFQHIVLL